MASSFICTSIDLLSSGGLKVMPVSFVSSLLCTLKSFLIVQASPFSNPVSNFLNCLLSFRDYSFIVCGTVRALSLQDISGYFLIYYNIIPHKKQRCVLTVFCRLPRSAPPDGSYLRSDLAAVRIEIYAFSQWTEE